MKQFTLFITLGLLLAFIMVGCSENDDVATGDPTQDNKTADDSSISSLIIEEEGEISEFRGEDDFSDPLEEIYPVRFGRQITKRTTTRTIEYQDEDHATVTMDLTLEGIFRILTEDSVHVEKPFVDHGYRTYDMIRTGDRKERHRGWHIVATSGTEFWTENYQTEISQIHVMAGEIDTLITTVSEKINREDILVLPPQTEVTLTVTTAADNDNLFLHFRPHHRRPFEVNGDGTYSVTFMTPPHGERHNFTVDAMSNGTLFDDEAPYDSNGWGINFVVRP